MVHPEIRQDVPHQEIGPAVASPDQEEDRGGDQKAKIREKNEFLVLLLVQGTAGQEVVDATITILASCALALRLLLVVVVASHISEEVHRPAADLLGDQCGGGIDRGVLQQLVHLLEDIAHLRSMLVAGAWAEDHIPLQVAGGLVVLAMADLPAEVRDEECRMADPTDGVVERLAWRERLVTTLVCQHPQSRAEETLSEGVASPESGSEGHRRYILGCAVCVEAVEGAGK